MVSLGRILEILGCNDVGHVPWGEIGGLDLPGPLSGTEHPVRTEFMSSVGNGLSYLITFQ